MAILNTCLNMMLEISVAILTTCPKYDVETFHGHFEDV